MAHLTQYQMNKLARGDDITTDIVGKICTALDVKVDDTMDLSLMRRNNNVHK